MDVVLHQLPFRVKMTKGQNDSDIDAFFRIFTVRQRSARQDLKVGVSNLGFFVKPSGGPITTRQYCMFQEREVVKAER